MKKKRKRESCLGVWYNRHMQKYTHNYDLMADQWTICVEGYRQLPLVRLNSSRGGETDAGSRVEKAHPTLLPLLLRPLFNIVDESSLS